MAFFDAIGKKIVQTGQDTVQKTKNMTESLKLSGQISDEEKGITQLYTKIGETYFALHEGDPEEPMAAFVREIQAARVRIQSYAEQIKALRGIAKCPKCGGEIPAEATFCSHCGQAVEAAQPAGQTGPKCPKCGAPVEDDQVFCVSCGQKIEKPELSLCPGCGKANVPGTAFCSGCGQKL